MFYTRPYYSGALRNPFVQTSSPYEQLEQQARAEALAEERARRRAQWLPDEASDAEWYYDQLSPRDRAYVQAQRRQANLERLRQQEVALAEQREELARRQAIEQRLYQQAIAQKQREEEEAQRKFLEARRSQIQRAREEEALRMAAAMELERVSPSDSGRVEPNSNISEQRLRARQTQAQPQPRTPSQERARPAEPQRTPSPQSKPATSPTYTDEHADAASVIQQQYRLHLSSKALDDVASQFESLKNAFVYPTVIEFQETGTEDAHVTVHATRPPSDDEETMDVDGQEPKLAYTATNYPIHNYTDALDKLLMKLDGVESWGKKEIRDKRRGIVHEISKESSRLDRYLKQAWMDSLKKEQPVEVVPVVSSEPEPAQQDVNVDVEQLPVFVESMQEQEQVEVDQQQLSSSIQESQEEAMVIEPEEQHPPSALATQAVDVDVDVEQDSSSASEHIPEEMDELHEETQQTLPLDSHQLERVDIREDPQQALSLLADSDVTVEELPAEDGTSDHVALVHADEEEEEVEVLASLDDEPVEVEIPTPDSPKTDGDAAMDLEWAML